MGEVWTPKRAAREILRRDDATRNLIDFTNYTKLDYRSGRHHGLIAHKLEEVLAGRIRRLMIIAPPRHGKSELASRRFPAFFLGRFPGRQIICTTYNQDNADDFGLDVRDIISSRRYQALFPGVQIRPDKRAAGRWNTTHGGIYISAGVGAGITGKGADLALIDDPYKDRAEADSPARKTHVLKWYKSTLHTRLMPGGAIVLILTRWVDDDIAGVLLEEMEKGGEQWDVLHLPAIALGTDDPLGRREGEALWPEEWPLEELQAKRIAIGSSEFIPLYQGTPSAAEGNIFKREWWGTYDVDSPLPPIFYTVQAWDTAEKKGEENDFSVCTTWGVGPGGIYLLSRWKQKVEYPELLKMAIALNDAQAPTHVVIEDTSHGTALIQDINALNRKFDNNGNNHRRIPVLAFPIDTRTDKIARSKRVSPLVESGQVKLPSRAPWLADYLDNMSAFPKGAHDDDVDSTVVALEYIRNKLNVGRPEYETVTSRRSSGSERRVAF